MYYWPLYQRDSSKVLWMLEDDLGWHRGTATQPDHHLHNMMNWFLCVCVGVRVCVRVCVSVCVIHIWLYITACNNTLTHAHMPASHHSVFLQARCPSCHQTNSIKAQNTFTQNTNDSQLLMVAVIYTALSQKYSLSKKQLNKSKYLITHTHTHTHTHTTFLLLFWNLSGTTRVSRYQKGKTRKVKTNLDLLEQEIVSGSGIWWAICKSAPHPRQPHQHPTTQFFYRPDALPAAQPTASKQVINTW